VKFPTTGVYRTAAVDAVPDGWAELPSGGWVFAPFVDKKTGLYARCDYDVGAQVLAAFEARYLTLAQAQEVIRLGIWIKPCPQTPGNSMASLEWARRHDECVRAQMKPDDIDKLQLPAKIWLAGAPPNKSINYGFVRRAGDPSSVIQSPGYAHDRRHVDYSQLLQGWTPNKPG
jgi:hypothetical protein